MFGLLPESAYSWIPDLVQVIYLLAIALFIIGLKRLSSPATARSGNQMASLAMFIGVIITLLDQNILTWEYILGGVVLGSAIGMLLAKRVEMTAMPELVALFNGFGGAASVLVALGEYERITHEVSDAGLASMLTGDITITLGLSVLIGALTFTGSVLAFGKLKGIVTGKPVTFIGQKLLNALLFLTGFGGIVMFVMNPSDPTPLFVLTGVAAILGVMSVIPIGGADMPVVISLLNSYSGLAASATGFVLNNNLLIVSGALVGASGLILTNIMCKAMNRSLANVLFGAFGGGDSAGAVAVSPDGSPKTVKEVTADDLAVMVAYAERVVVVPGYGLAVAQAQHAIREVADILEDKGVNVKYGIHPVAGRMPGHMNVLLAEANVPYDQLLDMDEVNPELSKTDVVLVIGANDVVNPDARTNTASPIYGMPIINVDEAKNVIIFKRSLNPGFAGIDNQLFYLDNSFMFFGDAKKSLTTLLGALKDV